MENLYTLLRDNKTSGPYTFIQLIQLSLTHTDLLWIEGKSTSWKPAAEIEEVKPIVKQKDKPQPTFKVVPNYEEKDDRAELVVKYARTLEDIRNDYDNWKKNGNSSEKNWKTMFLNRSRPAAAIIGLLVMLGFIHR